MWRELICVAKRASHKPERAKAVRTRRGHAGYDQPRTCREPTLDDMLSDPIVRDLMRADGVNASELATMLGRVGSKRSQDKFVPAE
jgi:hypothetical protein